jgi:hypothetical protein
VVELRERGRRRRWPPLLRGLAEVVRELLSTQHLARGVDTLIVRFTVIVLTKKLVL